MKADFSLSACSARCRSRTRDPAPGGEQVLEPSVADELLAPVPGPGQKSLVDLDDGPIGQRRDIPARGIFIKVFDALLEQRRGNGFRTHAAASLTSFLDSNISAE